MEGLCLLTMNTFVSGSNCPTSDWVLIAQLTSKRLSHLPLLRLAASRSGLSVIGLTQWEGSQIWLYMGRSKTLERALERRYIIYPSSEISEAQVPIKKLDFRASTFFSPFSLSLLSSYNIKHNPSYSLWLSSFSSEFQWQVLEGKLEERGKYSITYPLACRGSSSDGCRWVPEKFYGRYITKQLGLMAAAANIERL